MNVPAIFAEKVKKDASSMTNPAFFASFRSLYKKCQVVNSSMTIRGFANTRLQLAAGLFLKIALLILLAGCSSSRNSALPETPVFPAQPDDPGVGKMPVIRVSLIENVNKIRFEIDHDFAVYDAQGKPIIQNASGRYWEATVASAAPVNPEYRLRYATVTSRREAQRKRIELTGKNIFPDIIERKSKLDDVTRKTYHIVLRQKFDNEAAAQAKRSEMAQKASFEVIDLHADVISGEIEVRNRETGVSYTFPSGALFRSKRFTLHDVPVGQGFHWEKKETRKFRETFTLRVNSGGKLTIINSVPLENYLLGVVPSEMHGKFPLEALKAQAIAARTKAMLALASEENEHKEKGFDLCATVHCQVYSGSDRETSATNEAVAQTFGSVLQNRGALVQTTYMAVCGGHTENNENAWDGPARSHLRGVFDGQGAPGLLGDFLTNESYVEKWVSQNSPANCNLVTVDAPESMNYAKKYFRWRVKERRAKIEKALREATKEDFGQLRDILPILRGVSGRIKRVKIIGTKKSFSIDKELNIRRALHPQTLYSSCFIVKKSFQDGAGLPETFTFIGAGWGHGVGMCQIGAAGMARKGADFETILTRYYNGVEIASAY